jgi:hypothetical protein
MAFAENHLEQNRHLQSQSFHQRHINENTHRKIDQKINHDSELDLTHDESLNSIFVTDSSKNFATNEQNISQDRTTTLMNTG